jgi:hypothetical protein
MNLMVGYQAQMSKAVWKPSSGRGLGFLVAHDGALLGLIALTSPVIRLTVRDNFLFPGAPDGFNYGWALRGYTDLSVCVAAQPIGWHWNIGKLLAMIAPTLGDYVKARYPKDEFKGVTTTSLYGGQKATQYTRIYKYLGETKGYGHEHVDDKEYELMVRVLKACHALPGCKFEDGSNAKMRRIAAFRKLTGDRTTTLHHGHLRGVYYHSAVPPGQRAAVIQKWYSRWGFPRYERTKNSQPPYQSGLTGPNEAINRERAAAAGSDSWSPKASPPSVSPAQQKAAGCVS